MAVSIPLRNYPDQAFTVSLDTKPYLIAVRWNTRAALWSMTISRTDGTAIVSGLVMTPGFPLIRRFRSPELPAGELYVLGPNSDYSIVGRYDWGSTAQLVYFDEAEADEIEAAT